jgi:hypothetical protein
VRVGYCHYRWEVYPPEDERSDGEGGGAAELLPVGYIYEVQLEAGVRALGLGSLMLRLLEAWVRANAPHALLQAIRQCL